MGPNLMAGALITGGKRHGHTEEAHVTTEVVQ